MTGQPWRQSLDAYLALRRAVGFAMRPEERVLRDFVAHLERQAPEPDVVAQAAVTWATSTSGHNHAHRLSVVRGFLAAMHAADARIAVPGTGLLRAPRRPTPHLYTGEEVRALMEAARALGPCDGLRPHVIATVIGLLASCGLRGSEAIRLDLRDVDLEATPPHLHVRETKFRKSRLVPLHPTTGDALRQYAAQRERLSYHRLCDAFFVSERGTRVIYHVLARTFVTLARRLHLRGPVGTRGASLHHLRHSFAVERLAAWTRAGVNVNEQLSTLAVYLGHVRPEDTYWYLTASPVVLEPAALRFEAFADDGRTP